MKIAVSGKGGVGKTTFSATLARLYAREGRDVLAVDVDPDANLGLALGFSEDELAQIVPITEMRELIQERTEADALNKIYKLNPHVSDIPERFAREVNGVRLLLLGTIDTAGRGCVCPEHVLVRRLVSHLVLRGDDVVIMDMEAGLEHLARGTAGGMDMFVIVVEPGARSVKTYRDVKRLATELEISRIGVVANKVRDEDDEAFIRERIPEDELLGIVWEDTAVMEADRRGASPFDSCPSLVEEVAAIKDKIERGARNGAGNAAA